METTAELMIMVIDFNDRNPVFERSRYSAQVYENLTVVCVITSLHCDIPMFLCLLLGFYITVLISLLLCLLYVNRCACCLVQLYWIVCCCVLCSYSQLTIAILY